MIEDKVTQHASPDDIDLLNLLERAYIFLHKFRKIFLIALIIGIALGCLAYFVSPKLYQSKLILHSSYLTNQEELEIIDYWNQLLQRNERPILAPIVNARAGLLDNLVSLEGVEIQKNYSSTDPNGFYIIARVRDNTILPELQHSITYGLDNTEFVKQKISEKRSDLEELIGKIKKEIAELDSLKTSLETKKESNAGGILLNIENINKDINDRNEKLVSYQTQLKSVGSVQVLQGFIPLNTPVSRGLKVSILLGVIVSLAVAYLFSLLKAIEYRLKKRVRTHA